MQLIFRVRNFWQYHTIATLKEIPLFFLRMSLTRLRKKQFFVLHTSDFSVRKRFYDIIKID